MTQNFNDLDETKGSIVFVTIGVPFSRIPIMQKVMVFVEEDVDTHVTAAKKLRKQVADNIENHGWVKGTQFNPSELYFEIFGLVDNEIPFAMSSNAPSAKVILEEIDGRAS